MAFETILPYIKLLGKIAFVTGLMKAWPVLASLPLWAVDPINTNVSPTTHGLRNEAIVRDKKAQE
jgi:hypothetical protein